MAVKVTVTPISGISAIPGDTAPVGDPTWLPSIYNAVAMEFTVKFEYEGEAGAPPEGGGEAPPADFAPILSVEATVAPEVEGIVFTKVGTDTINVKGTPVNVFKDEVFRFLFDDKSERNLSPTNTEDWKTIVKWAKPSKNEETVVYSFIVEHDENPAAVVPIEAGTDTVALSQNIAWKFDPSLAYFQDLIKRGKV